MASLPYVQQLSKVIVAQITQTIGWHSIQTTPLELLSDILHKYLEELTRQTQRYAELYGRTEPNLDDVALAFGDLNIQIPDLEEYIVNVDSVPCIFPVPKFPVPKESNLNFLKAGSKEVVTRPVYVHEHLPPIHPQEEPQPAAHENGNSNATADTSATPIYAPVTNHIKNDEDIHMFEIDGEHSESINVIGDTAVVENDAADDDYGNALAAAATFKKPLEPLNSVASSSVGRPTRELISCIMTTSGFISPAREGKLPDAKKPIVILEEEPPARPSPPPPRATAAPNNTESHHNNPISGGDHKKSGGRADDLAIAVDLKLEHPDQPFAASGTGDDIKPFKTAVPPLSVDGDNVRIKKKLKYADAASLKELKKAKKLSQSKSAKLANAKNRKLNKVLNKLMVKPSKRKALLLESGAIDMCGDMSHLSEEEMMTLLSAKKKLKMQQSMKRKYKKELLLKKSGSKQKASADGGPGTSPQKQRKKRELKIPKHEQGNLPSANSYPYPGDRGATTARPYPSEAVEDSSSIGVDKEESMDMMGGEYQHLDKLSNEPDKRKLNIFKKISTPSSSSNQLASQSYDPNSPIVRKSSKMHSDATPWSSAEQSQQAMTPVKMHDMSVHSTPLFSDPALLTSTPYPVDAVSGKKSKLKGMPKVPKTPKIPKEKKLKKDLTQRKPRTPKAPKAFMPQHLNPPMPVVQPDLAASRMPMPMPMFPNMGFLDQFSGPGLIPSNPLFQSVPFGMPGNNQMPPFSVLPSYSDLLNFSRFKRPNFNEASPSGSVDPNRNPAHNVRHEAIKEEACTSVADKSVKPLCHVAPFVPQSLLSSVEMRSRSKDPPNADDDHAKRTSSGQGSAKPWLDHDNRPTGSTRPSTESHDQSSNAPTYDDQKTTIIIDSDDDDENFTAASNDCRWYSPGTSNAAPSDRDTSQFSDESKRHTKKIKDKSTTGHRDKKDKKDKDGSGIKMKKKKDKKDKTKSKEKDHKDKAALKEEKRKKKKEKDRLAAAAAAAAAAEADAMSSTGASFSGAFNPTSHAAQSSYPESMARGEPSRDTFDGSEYAHDTANFEASAIPKLTLKLAPSSSSPSSRPSTPDFPSSKKSSKSWKKKNKWLLDDESDRSQSGHDDSNYQPKRDSSPELARISALITRPPKQKSKESPSRKISSGADYGEHSDATHSTSRSDFYTSSSIPTTSAVPTGPGRGRPKGSTNSNKNKNKAHKSSSLSATGGSVSFSEPISSSAMDTSSRQASVLQTLDQEMADENQVWICPACGRVDDGTPMIGCDGCDAWYHWVCVGIQVPPDQDQDWYCRVCISKKQEIDKKKKRKKKDKKDH